MSVECAERLAASYNMCYLELSSKTGSNIVECFQSLGKSIKATKETVESFRKDDAASGGRRRLDAQDDEEAKSNRKNCSC